MKQRAEDYNLHMSEWGGRSRASELRSIVIEILGTILGFLITHICWNTLRLEKVEGAEAVLSREIS